MPLLPCPECQTPVSESAPQCPKCGRPYPTARRASKANQLAASWAILLLFAGGTGIGMFLARGQSDAMYAILLVGLTPVIWAAKHLAEVKKRKEW